MANSMNPVNLYHDPSLDILLSQNRTSSTKNTNSSRRHSNGHHRRPTSDNLTHEQVIPPPTAPDVPQGPPISYRGFGGTDPTVHRSFSQRVNGRPFPREAFADQDLATTSQQTTPISYQSAHPSDEAPTVARRKPVPNETLRLTTTNLNGNPVPYTQGQDPTSSRDPRSVSLPSATRSQSQHTATPSRAHHEPPSAVTRSSAFQNDSQRRDWAPDRSPLQKLEVTLNDISKEEKRARVQEAEMLLRERNANRQLPSSTMVPLFPDTEATTSATGGQASGQQAPQTESMPPPTQDHALVRSLSTTQRQRLQHSTTLDNHRPDARRLSGEKHPGFDYTISSTVASPPTTTRGESRKYRRQDHTENSTRGYPSDHSQRPLDGSLPPTIGDHHQFGVSDAEPLSKPSTSRRLPENQPRPMLETPTAVPMSRRELGDREMNASHKAALEKLTAGAAPNVRNGSRKLQKPPPAVLVPSGNRTGAAALSSRIPVPTSEPLHTAAIPTARTASNATARAIDSHVNPRSQDHPSTPPTGVGPQPSPHPSSPRSPPERVIDVTRQRQRKSNVSFKEPMKRRPVDEWKEAGIARLSAVDFLTTADSPREKAKAWWEHQGSAARRRSVPNKTADHTNFDASIDDKTAEFSPKLFVRCGPLLRYTGIKTLKSDAGDGSREIWRGSVMIVTQDSHSSYDPPPTLRLFSQPQRLLPPPPQMVHSDDLSPEYVDPIAGLTKLSRTGRALYVRPVDHLEEGKDLSHIENDDGLFESSPSPLEGFGAQSSTTRARANRVLDNDGERLGRYQEVRGARLYADPDRDVTFWRFNLEIELGESQKHIAYRINGGPSVGFWVPAHGETMNIMFHSCNGFSLAVNPDNFSGPDPLWRDVLNTHQTRPFHVMIGGGDQIYNDRVMLDTHHFGAWTRMRNPNHKHNAPFTNEMKEELESFYLHRYSTWFSQGLFSMAASQIPMINIWDDHDIIDGFGSYPNHFMETPVFSGLGNVAFKYYMLFQHQSVPEETTAHEPSWLLGHEPGPFIKQLSRSVFMRLGKHVAFLGLDCRTERMHGEVLSVDTIDVILERCRKELIEGETKHLLLLLGIPIAYPRLVWLENVLTSRLMDPVKALGRAGIIKGGFLNKFDGGVEILDDLDDHWTSTNHKSERNDLVKDLQDLAAEKSCRISILSGDVHLGAIGQFHSNPKLKIPKDRDHRYMPNVISSAIVNSPPSDMLADILNKRNKTHHLDRYTDENMIPMFTHDVDGKKRNNKHMLPRRNWCSIREYVPGSTPPPSPPDTPDMSDISGNDEILEGLTDQRPPARRFLFSKEDVSPRNLLRRLSSRRAPPNSYRDMMYEQGRSASHDGTLQAQHRARPNSRSVSDSRQSSVEYGAQTRPRAASLDHNSNPALMRPGVFMRRPTNLSEKAARKGNIPAVDAEGKEIDVNDSINLAGGLDVVLNMEISQKDPSGITMPYRLLIPALWYDGSSDREKLDEASGVERRAPIFSRFGFTGRRGQKATRTGADHNMAHTESEYESYSEEEEIQQRTAQPRRRFSLFGSRRPKEQPSLSGTESDEDERDPEGGAGHPIAPRYGQPPQRTAIAPTTSTRTAQIPQNPTGPASHDVLYDTERRPPPDHNIDPRMHPSTRRSLTITSEGNRRHQPMRVDGSARSTSDSYTRLYPESPVTAKRTDAVQALDAIPREESGSEELYEDFPPSRSAALAGSVPQRRLSKQERVLGISQSDPPLPAMPHQLRGNGIIGRDLNGPVPAQRIAASHQPTGYSGIEAWKEPRPRRGFSLRKARDWLDGRGRGDKDEFD
ncbi:hypothetical protein PV10_07920 [Exophiala mesophila]|uniref:PhoD-like phosphatase domain-containing protein n=1 Tax=Exophiala mesophila TaxID=212818 RepID=A0A0D1Z747_EXOME|nr:uncharacterized protein PV10_07920 [Exophiala mesophila]KIV90637.1 hypothetical protein PV10_07920 [Exophiala mesophila]